MLDFHGKILAAQRGEYKCLIFVEGYLSFYEAIIYWTFTGISLLPYMVIILLDLCGKILAAYKGNT